MAVPTGHHSRHVVRHDLHPPDEAKSPDGPVQCVRPALTNIDQHHPEIGALHCDDEARESAAASDIDDQAPSRGKVHHPDGMCDRVLDRGRTEMTLSLLSSKNVDQWIAHP